MISAKSQNLKLVANVVQGRSCYRQARTVLGQHGAVPRLLAAMRCHTDHEGVQRAACAALCNLSFGCEGTEIGRELEENGAVGVVVAAMHGRLADSAGE